MSPVAGAVLAAGAGTRMGTPKAEVILAGRRLVDRAITALRAAGCDPVIAVVRPDTTVGGARAVVNADPDRGMRSSLALAVEAAALARSAGLAVVLVDAPGVGPAAIRTTVAAWRPGRVAVVTYAGRRAHPIVMAPEQWRAAITSAGPDEGARRWLAEHADLIDEVPVTGDPADIDTPDDLRNWTR